MESTSPRLNDAEARVLGVLIEKSLTTPDNYPLSLNATLNGCNQRSNRNPVTSFVEAEVVVALQGLVPKGFATRVMGAGSRVEKFRHTAGKALDLDDGHLAVLAELLLRGPQAQGELRARVHRMVATRTLEDLRPRIDALVARGLAKEIPPAPGTRAARFVQCLAPDLHPVEAAAPSTAATPAPAASPASGGPSLEGRVAALEGRVDEMARKLDDLLVRLGDG